MLTKTNAAKKNWNNPSKRWVDGSLAKTMCVSVWYIGSIEMPVTAQLTTVRR